MKSSKDGDPAVFRLPGAVPRMGTRHAERREKGGVGDGPMEERSVKRDEGGVKKRGGEKEAREVCSR